MTRGAISPIFNMTYIMFVFFRNCGDSEQNKWFENSTFRSSCSPLTVFMRMYTSLMFPTVQVLKKKTFKMKCSEAKSKQTTRGFTYSLGSLGKSVYIPRNRPPTRYPIAGPRVVTAWKTPVTCTNNNRDLYNYYLL